MAGIRRALWKRNGAVAKVFYCEGWLTSVSHFNVVDMDISVINSNDFVVKSIFL